MNKLFTVALLAISSSLSAEPYLVLDIASEAGDGEVVINLRSDLAPKHVERIVQLTNEGAYNGIVFHRVIEGFMAQTGDVEFGKFDGDNLSSAGMGGSKLPDLAAEFSETPFVKGVVGMARSASPDSANSQFFIMFGEAGYLNGQYTVIGEIVKGQEVVDALKKGTGDNGLVEESPDYIRSAKITESLEEMPQAAE